MQPPDSFPTFLAELACLFYARLTEQHLPDETAQHLAIALADDVGRTYEGCQIYVPKRDGCARARRDALIQADHTAGASVAECARRYRLTVAQVYAILKK